MKILTLTFDYGPDFLIENDISATLWFMSIFALVSGKSTIFVLPV